MKKLILIFSVVLLVAVLFGCASLSTQGRWEAQLYATNYAERGEIPPTKYLTMAAENGIFIPLATATPVFMGTPTMSMMEFSGTQIAQQQSVSLTESWNKLQMEQQRLAAEAEAERAAARAEAMRMTSEVISLQQTADAKIAYGQQTAWAASTQAMATNYAAATGTAWQWAIDQENTRIAAVGTAAVLPTHAQWTQAAVFAIQTIEQGEANKVALAVKKQTMTNAISAFSPWVILFGSLATLALGFREFVRIREHARDEHGRTKAFSHSTKDGSIVWVDGDRMQEPIVKILADGNIIRYASDPEAQARVNHDSKVVDALSVLPGTYSPVAGQIMGANFGKGGVRVQVTADVHNSAIDEAERKFIEEDSNV